MFSSLKEHIPRNCETEVDYHLKVSICLELPEHLLLRFQPKVLLLHLCQLTEMILELASLKLLQIVRTQNHVLYELSNLLMKLDNIRLLMHKILNLCPLLE